MSAAQLTLAILTALTPTVAVLLATIIQRQDVRDLRNEMITLRNQVNTDMNDLSKSVNTDMNDLRKSVNTDLVALRNQVHADLLMIHERVATVESKQG